MSPTALAERNRALARRRHAVPLGRKLLGAALSLSRGLARPAEVGPLKRVLVALTGPARDVLFATPAIHALKAALPGAQIVGAVSPWGEPVLRNNPDLDGLIVIDFPEQETLADAAEMLEFLRGWPERLRGFDAALLAAPDHWLSALLVHRAGIPRRVGAATSVARALLTQRIELDPADHLVVQALELVAGLTGHVAPRDILRFEISAQETSVAARLLSEHVGPDERLVAIHSGAPYPVETWRAEGWAAVADQLAYQLEARIVLTGHVADDALCCTIAAGMRSEPVNLAGRADLGHQAAIFRRCRLVLGGDSAALHVAVALGVPSVQLYGPSDPAQSGPWGGNPARHIVITPSIECAPCGVRDWPADDLENHPCLRDMTAYRVLEAAQIALGEAPPVHPLPEEPTL
jgi:ADP-heptose:LPS heptosyltransferase